MACFFVQGQTLKDTLLGKWKLIALVNKTASALELSKRYEFTATDTLHFTNSRTKLSVKYVIDEDKKQIKLIRSGFPDAYLGVKILSATTIELKDLGNENSAPGIVERLVE